MSRAFNAPGAPGYIGITGFGTRAEVEEVGRHIDKLPLGYFMFGFTSSNKRLADPLSKGGTSPPLVSLLSLIEAVPQGHLPMIHYFSSNSPDTLADEVISLYRYCGINPDTVGLQLNAEWPAPEQLAKIRKELGQATTITLQLPKSVLKKDSTKFPSNLAIGLKDYQDLISYVLIDPSGGTGEDFSQTVSLPQIAELMQSIIAETTITPGIAGGLSHENVGSTVSQLKQASRCKHCQQPGLENICVDAQGKLRKSFQTEVAYPPHSPPVVSSQLHPRLANLYVDAALSAFFS